MLAETQAEEKGVQLGAGAVRRMEVSFDGC